MLKGKFSHDDFREDARIRMRAQISCQLRIQGIIDNKAMFGNR